jgi:hypothetical protein
MLKLCPACKYYRLPKPRPQISAGSAPGEFEAFQRWKGWEDKRRADEQRRVNDGFRFDYEPLFFSWCKKYTPVEDDSKDEPSILENVKRGLMNGDTRAFDEAEQNGMNFVIDPANGTVSPVYTLCLRKNEQGDCVGFEKKDTEKI